MTGFLPATSGADPADADVVVCHATGFCKETLAPVIDEWEHITGGSVDAMLVDARGHGESTPHRGPFTWDAASDDVVALVSDRSAPLIGIGHSLGGAIVARVEIKRPGTFRHLVLLEPIVFPGPFGVRDIPLSVAAENRRRAFASRDAAYMRFERGPFSRWDPRSLAAYVDHGFRETPNGWELKCAPSVEAEVFRQGSNVDTWDRLGEVGCPVTIIAGEESDTHTDPFLSLLADRFMNAAVVTLPGLGHLFPMEDPVATARAIHRAVSST